MQIQLVAAEVANITNAAGEQVRATRDTVTEVTDAQWEAMDDDLKTMFIAHPDPDDIDGDGAIDNIEAEFLIELPDTATNGFVVKVAGDDTLYGKGQAFMVLEEGAGDATDQGRTGSVLFRVDAKGGVGVTGGVHIAAGLRKPMPANTAALWIDPSQNVTPLVIHNPTVAEDASWTSPFMQIVDVRNANRNIFKITNVGAISTYGNVVVAEADAAGMVTVGAVFGLPGIGFGTAVDAILVRTAAGIISVFDAFEFTEKAAPAAPAVNKVRLFSQDNGAGKTQLCARFNTGAVAVLATQP